MVNYLNESVNLLKNSS